MELQPLLDALKRDILALRPVHGQSDRLHLKTLESVDAALGRRAIAGEQALDRQADQADSDGSEQLLQATLQSLKSTKHDLNVARRVLQGGHSIPENVIHRRFKAGLENFLERYSKVVDAWALFDSYQMLN